MNDRIILKFPRCATQYNFKLQVLIAMDDVMQWIETVLMEVNGIRGSEYDISFSKVFLNLDRIKITTTIRTTVLQTVSSNFLSKCQIFIKIIFFLDYNQL